MARNAFNDGEVWNPVCCHGNKTFTLVFWNTFNRIMLKRIKCFWYKLAEISFFIIFDHHLANLNICGRKRNIENNEKRYLKIENGIFLLDYLFMFKMPLKGKMLFSSQYMGITLRKQVHVGLQCKLQISTRKIQLKKFQKSNRLKFFSTQSYELNKPHLMTTCRIGWKASFFRISQLLY